VDDDEIVDDRELAFGTGTAQPEPAILFVCRFGEDHLPLTDFVGKPAERADPILILADL
jgi:hypothetical protein